MDASLGERLASALLSYIEEPEPKAPAQHRPKATRNIEAELLQGGSVVAAASSPQAAAKPQSELEMLHADVARLLQQREQLTARLIAEQERRERAEAELVSLGAQWLGTETQQALQERAESERRRVLDAEREAIRREAEQRISKAEAQATMLREKLGKDAPTQMQLRMQLRAALRAELEHERSEARAAVEQQLSALTSERDGLAAELRRAEANHKIELKALAQSVRQAAQMLQEQYDKGFVCGLQQAAQALGATDAGTTKPSTANPPQNTQTGADPSMSTLEHSHGDDKDVIDAANDDRTAADDVDVNDDDNVSGYSDLLIEVHNKVQKMEKDLGKAKFKNGNPDYWTRALKTTKKSPYSFEAGPPGTYGKPTQYGGWTSKATRDEQLAAFQAQNPGIPTRTFNYKKTVAGPPPSDSTPTTSGPDKTT